MEESTVKKHRAKVIYLNGEVEIHPVDLIQERGQVITMGYVPNGERIGWGKGSFQLVEEGQKYNTFKQVS
jgi:hypothetical protein